MGRIWWFIGFCAHFFIPLSWCVGEGENALDKALKDLPEAQDQQEAPIMPIGADGNEKNSNFDLEGLFLQETNDEGRLFLGPLPTKVITAHNVAKSMMAASGNSNQAIEGQPRDDSPLPSRGSKVSKQRSLLSIKLEHKKEASVCRHKSASSVTNKDK